MKKYRIIFALALIVFITGTAITIANASNDIDNSVLRFHIRANSNSQYDQDIKLKVRDHITQHTQELLAGCQSREHAVQVISQNLDFLEKIANEALAQMEVSYTAHVKLERTYFPTREYGQLILPAGEYLALIIELGEGAGENWWCVVFPPLCYTGDVLEADGQALSYLKDTLSPEEYRMVTGDDSPKIVYRFKLVEIFAKIKQWLF